MNCNMDNSKPLDLPTCVTCPASVFVEGGVACLVRDEQSLQAKRPDLFSGEYPASPHLTAAQWFGVLAAVVIVVVAVVAFFTS